MLALFALIPARVYEYAAIILVCALAFAGYTHHERSIEHAKDLQAAAAAVTKANAVVQKDDATAATEESTNATVYERAVSIPAIGDLGIDCVRHAAPARSVPLPTTDTGAAPGSGNQVADSGIGPAYDPTGAALTRGVDADAQIIYLQGRIRELEQQMNDAP
jgi:hypothetical protein